MRRCLPLVLRLLARLERVPGVGRLAERPTDALLRWVIQQERKRRGIVQ